MILVYHPEASQEIYQAFEWYESQKRGLGLQFTSELELAIRRIETYPLLNPIIDKKYRRAIVPIFPYGVFYKISSDYIFVLAVAHLHRMPKYWISRN